MQPSDKAFVNSDTLEYAPPPYEFRLKPKDIVTMNVFSLTPGEYNFFNRAEAGTESAMQFIVSPEGNLKLPVVKDIHVSGLTIEEAQDSISKAYSAFLTDPIVTIQLTSFNYSMLGEVKVPGVYNSTAPVLNVFQAVARAGDMTDFADRSHIRLIRNSDDGKRYVYQFSMTQDSLLASDLYYVKPNDIIIVDALKAKGIRQNQVFSITTALGIITSVSFILLRFI